MYRADLIYRHPKLLIILNVFLAFLLLFFALIFVREVISAKTHARIGKPVSSPLSVPQKTRMKAGLQEYSGIMRNNPFGFPAGQLKELSAAKGDAPSHSDITLTGTVSGARHYSYAIFADKSGKQEIFRIGESVFGGGKLKRVEPDKVFIIEDGREVKIPLAEVLTIKDIGPAEAGALSSDFARSTGRGTYVVDQRKVLQALENPNQLMTDARLQPNISGGKQDGFILREVRNGGIYQSLGLQNGDVLLRINDYNISNPENALQAFTALRGMDRVQVDIVRSGAKMTMTYQIR